MLAAAVGSEGVLSHNELKKYIQDHPALKEKLMTIGAGDENCGWSGVFKGADVDGDGKITLAVSVTRLNAQC